MLSDDDRRTLELFAARVRERFPDARIWAFGSRARGTAEHDSDFDICLVLDQRTDEIRKAISYIAWEIGFDLGMVISTVVYSHEEFYEGPCSVSPLVCTILKEGVAA